MFTNVRVPCTALRFFYFWLNPTCFVRQTGAVFAANFELSFTRVLVESVALRLLLLLRRRRRLLLLLLLLRLIVLKNVYSMLILTQPSF